MSEPEDIIEQLRLRASYLGENSLYSRAADTIEQLRLEIDRQDQLVKLLQYEVRW
jgi:hypothetical protein